MPCSGVFSGTKSGVAQAGQEAVWAFSAPVNDLAAYLKRKEAVITLSYTDGYRSGSVFLSRPTRMHTIIEHFTFLLFYTAAMDIGCVARA